MDDDDNEYDDGYDDDSDNIENVYDDKASLILMEKSPNE